VFQSFDLIFAEWLDAISDISSDGKVSTIKKLLLSISETHCAMQPIVIKSLARLFLIESETTKRYSTIAAEPNLSSLAALGFDVHPWQTVLDKAAEGPEGLASGLSWLRVMAQSGVNIPDSTYLQLSAFARDFSAPFKVEKLLIETTMSAAYIKAMGRQDLVEMIADIHTRVASHVDKGLSMSNDTSDV